MTEIIYKAESFKIIGAFINKLHLVHSRGLWTPKALETQQGSSGDALHHSRVCRYVLRDGDHEIHGRVLNLFVAHLKGVLQI